MSDLAPTRWVDLGERTLEDLQIGEGRATARSRYRLSEWSADGGFAHGADVLPALWHMGRAVLPPGELLQRVEEVRFRKMIFEQLALTAGDAPPVDADLLVTWSTSRERRVSVWGRFDGRPLDRDVLLARNPLVFSRVPEPLSARTAGSTIEWEVEALAPELLPRLREEGPAGRLSAFLDLAGFLSRMMKSVARVKPDAYFLIAGLREWVTPEAPALSAAATMRAEVRWSGKRKTRTDTWLLPIEMSWTPHGAAAPEGGGTVVAAYDDVAFTFAEPWLTAASTK
jgi:hypothetical protein